ncbi:MAG TPA: hypothetical protein VJN89_08445 [Candidatus Acidoferrum sp.]|nr:hypothetical protein [Candidatus Acidoferrum sp.]
MKSWKEKTRQAGADRRVHAGFHDFPRKALGDLDGFGNAAAFGHQSWNIRASAQVAAILQVLDANPNGHSFNFGEMLFINDSLQAL